MSVLLSAEPLGPQVREKEGERERLVCMLSESSALTHTAGLTDRCGAYGLGWGHEKAPAQREFSGRSPLHTLQNPSPPRPLPLFPVLRACLEMLLSQQFRSRWGFTACVRSMFL